MTKPATLTNPTELRDNSTFRLFERFSQEARLVIIASIALLAAILATLLSGMAINNSIHAKIRAEYQDKEIADLKGDIDVYRIRSAKLNAYLQQRGIPAEVFEYE